MSKTLIRNESEDAPCWASRYDRGQHGRRALSTDSLLAKDLSKSILPVTRKMVIYA